MPNTKKPAQAPVPNISSAGFSSNSSAALPTSTPFKSHPFHDTVNPNIKRTAGLRDDPIVDSDANATSPLSEMPTDLLRSSPPVPQLLPPVLPKRTRLRTKLGVTVPEGPTTEVQNWSSRNPPPAAGTQPITDHSRKFARPPAQTDTKAEGGGLAMGGNNIAVNDGKKRKPGVESVHPSPVAPKRPRITRKAKGDD